MKLLQGMAGVVLLWALPLFAQTSPLTVTPTRVSVQLGQPLYCAAAWSKSAGTVQVYCYTSTANHTWDSLIFNSIFFVNTSATLPYVWNCPPGTPASAGCTSAGIFWLFRQDPKTPGVVDWQVSWNGTGTGSGTFQ